MMFARLVFERWVSSKGESGCSARSLRMSHLDGVKSVSWSMLLLPASLLSSPTGDSLVSEGTVVSPFLLFSIYKCYCKL